MLYLVYVVCFSIVSIGTAEITLPCKNDVCANITVLLSNLNFTLFTRQNQMNGIVLNESTYNLVNTDDLTTLLIHGWTPFGDTRPWIPVMKDTYLNKTSANIIVVDWLPYTYDYFVRIACAVPQVGRFVGDFIHNLTKVGVDLEKVQMNGFSFGAHVAGAAGQRVFALTKYKVKRINGLEAAIQEFSDKPINQRLDASDATFVQAIHTNSHGSGFAENYGTIDFQVNYKLFTCGSYQIECPENSGFPNHGSPLPYIYCDHIRVVAYYIESINSDKFLGVKCSSCCKFGMGKCNSDKKTIMGEVCPYNQNGVRYLNTNAMPPFAQG